MTETRGFPRKPLYVTAELSDEQMERLRAAFIRKNLRDASAWPGNLVNPDWFEGVIGTVMADMSLVLSGSFSIDEFDQEGSSVAVSSVGSPPQPVAEWSSEECKVWLRAHKKRWWKK